MHSYYPKHTVNELMRYIEERFVCERIEPQNQELSYPIRKTVEVTKANIESATEIKESAMDLALYKLVSDRENPAFFKSALGDNEIDDGYILTVIEKGTSYVYSSSGKMYALFECYKGLDEEDVRCDNLRYRHLNFLVDMYPELKACAHKQ
ncbi:hypothetical protein ACR6HW_04680 [Fusibacter sp. JL298sf-3]